MFVAIVGASSFISMMNLISATTFTREGNNAQLLKIYPLSTRQIIYGKMLLGVFVNTLIIVPLIIALAIIAGAQFYLVLDVHRGLLFGESIDELFFNNLRCKIPVAQLDKRN